MLGRIWDFNFSQIKKFSSVHDGCYIIVFYTILLDIETSSMLCFWRNCYIWLAALKMMINLIKPGSLSRTQITWGFKWLNTWARCPTTPLHCETWTQGYIVKLGLKDQLHKRWHRSEQFDVQNFHLVAQILSHFGQSKLKSSRPCPRINQSRNTGSQANAYRQPVRLLSFFHNVFMMVELWLPWWD